MQKKAPFIIVISGVGGAGKDSILEVFRKNTDKFVYFVSYTDRPQRAGDIVDETYHFVTQEEFSKSIEKKEFIEWEQVRGEYRYGRKKADLDDILKSGRIPVMQIEVLGAQKFKKISKILSFFIMPPSIEEAKARLEKRGTDSAEAIRHRFDRYDLELSYKDKYDYIIVNDKLDRAQQEILDIVDREIQKSQKKSRLIDISVSSFLILLLCFTTAFGFFQSSERDKRTALERLTTLQPETSQEETVVEPTPEPAKTEAPVITPKIATSPPPTQEVKKKIASSPPQYTPPPQNVVGETKTNSDGSTTTAVSTGTGVNDADLDKIAQSDAQISSPLNIPFSDETGRFGEYQSVLLNYINSVLKWKNEISELKEIAVRDAGASGWLGVYEGNYLRSADGNSITGSGMIVINTYYIETQYCFGENDFDGCEGEYMKYILAHEYGHHYTIYHKMVDWGLLPNERFPESYYSTRPLSLVTTATDYSLGWENCEAEIIAEDYSYFYSGYGIQRMANIYGNPSPATKTWLDNIGIPAPTLTIISPTAESTLSGDIIFQINATSSIAILKVSFYLDDVLISSADNQALEMVINTLSYTNGPHVLKATVDNGILSTTKSINISIANTPPI